MHLNKLRDVSMEKSENIKEAIQKARKGIDQYLEIMQSFRRTDVSTDMNFQRKFNSFYRVRQRASEWYKEYYATMQREKDRQANFHSVLTHFYAVLGRYEPSFTSKLIATIDANFPVWDMYVLKNIAQRSPSYASKNKAGEAVAAYAAIQAWYEQYMKSEDARAIIAVFRDSVQEHEQISDVKKIDFVLWQTRT